MIDIIEKVSVDDSCNVKKDQSREIIENSSKVSGYVTIIKNKGRKDEQIIQKDKPNLLTTSGRDFFHAQVYTNITAGTRGGNVIGLSADVADPAAGDTSLINEITTGGLSRVTASSISHIAGSSLTTLEEEFTATAIFSAIHSSGLFNATTAPISGQMTHASKFDADVDLQVGDTITVTWALTLGA